MYRIYLYARSQWLSNTVQGTLRKLISLNIGILTDSEQKKKLETLHPIVGKFQLLENYSNISSEIFPNWKNPKFSCDF